LNGTASGGGYELALACDRILLVDDRNSAVSFPEVPLLGVLPGTGGLTRITDKRKVRRDRNDVFSTIAEGVKGKRAVEWDLVDALAPLSKWKEEVARHAGELARETESREGPGVELGNVECEARTTAGSTRTSRSRSSTQRAARGSRCGSPRTPDRAMRRRRAPPAAGGGSCRRSASSTTRS
jgi:benzoyl-CoA-dihydrodiol lyase